MEKSCLVIGGSSQIGSWLVPDLIESGWTVHHLSRGKAVQADYGAAAQWHRFDLAQTSEPFPTTSARVLFHTAGIGSVLPWLSRIRAQGVSRIIAFSSTSLFTKVDSNSSIDQDMIARLGGYEATLIATCEKLGLDWTILRPTMIHGGKYGDRTVQDIAKVIRTFGMFPLLKNGSGLRQPVHAHDLASACLQAVDCEAAMNRAYNLGGSERLRYREMVERIFRAMDRTPRLLPVPLIAFEAAVRVATLHPRYRHLTSSMAERMGQDMVFSNNEATTDFGYRPRGFAPVVLP